MLEKLEQCPLCGHTDTEKSLIAKDYTVTNENFVLEICKKCNFKFTNPRPGEDSIIKYYQSNEYISHNDTEKGLINKAYHLVKKKAIHDKLQLINKYHTKGKILDIGCGTGSFLEVCKKDGWIIEGVEPNEEARKRASIKTEQTISENLNQIKDKESFNIITMWHVLEHVHKLNETIIYLKNLLKKGGYLIIAVPNNNSYDAALYKEYWAAYDVPRHLYHFNKETLVLLLEKYNFNLKEIAPMKFDAFYISLLSYKYKYNKINYLHAIVKGLESNSWAKNNGNNYSSLIYIFEK